MFERRQGFKWMFPKSKFVRKPFYFVAEGSQAVLSELESLENVTKYNMKSYKDNRKTKVISPNGLEYRIVYSNKKTLK